MSNTIIQTSAVITIPLTEYNTLTKDSIFLECLNEAGVDNWEGYDEAIHSFKERDVVND